MSGTSPTKSRSSTTNRSRNPDQMVERWRSDLLDFSKRNQLLYFRPRQSGLHVVHPGADDLFNRLVQKQIPHDIHRPSGADDLIDTNVPVTELATELQPQLPLARDVSGDRGERIRTTGNNPAQPRRANEIVVERDTGKVDPRLYQFRLKARAALNEQGITILFVAFGTLEWRESPTSSESITSPLILAPVRLDRDSTLDPYRLTLLDDGIVLNPVLVRKLAVDFGLTLSLPEDDSDQNSMSALLEHLRGQLTKHRSWIVRDDVHLGLFSFAKYAMYQDLELHRDRFTNHPLIQLLSGNIEQVVLPTVDLLSADQLDDRVPPEEVFQVLDADASQHEAIAAVKAGASLIIQGPPGTGKSQTITNVIAETLAQGKTVLFVSEKMAALQVVAKRLAEAGLREFCLEAHSQAIDKASIVRELARALETGPHSTAIPGSVSLSQIKKDREQLNRYVRALHDARTPLEMSAFQVHGAIAQRIDLPSLSFDLPDCGSLTPDDLVRLTDIVRRLVLVGDVLLSGSDHPWYGASIDAFSPQTQGELSSLFASLSTTATRLAARQDAVRATLGLPGATSSTDARWLAGLAPILTERHEVPSTWHTTPSLEPLRDTAQDYLRRTREYERQRNALRDRYMEAIFALDLDRVRATLAAGAAPVSTRIVGAASPADRLIAQRDLLGKSLRRAVDSLDGLSGAIQGVASRLSLQLVGTLNEIDARRAVLEQMLSDPRPVASWFDAGQRGSLRTLIDESATVHATLVSTRSAIESRFSAGIFEHATPELRERFDDSYDSFLRILKPSYRRDMSQLRALITDGSDLDHSGALNVLREVERYREAESWLSERTAALSSGLGPHYAGQQTDWPATREALDTVGAVCDYFGSDGPPPVVRDVLLGSGGGPSTLRPLAIAVDHAMAEVVAALADLSRVMTLERLSLSGLELRDMSVTALRSLFQGWLEQFETFWQTIDLLRGCARETAQPGDVNAAIADVDLALHLASEERALVADEDDLRARFGHLYQGLATSWETILVSLTWLERLRLHFPAPLPETFVRVLAEGGEIDPQEWQSLTVDVTGIDELHASMLPLFGGRLPHIGQYGLDKAALRSVAAWASEKARNVPRLEEWVDLASIRAEAIGDGIGGFVAAIERERLPAAIWQDVFLRQVYVSWLSWRYAQSSDLARFRGNQHADVIERFADLDAAQFHANAARVASVAMRTRPEPSLAIVRGSEVNVLQREAAKKRRFRPLRQLFADLPTLLPALKPCILMSPLAVAQHLGESPVVFDVVIFDEASQILPADAIGAIGRGVQAVVVGDRHQLPPTRFFAAEITDVDEETDEELPESILDAYEAAGLPTKRLLWHYRSRHEELIAFSNREFYDGRLVTFPSPASTERPIEFIHVEDGIYDRAASRQNQIEARRVVDLIVEHVETTPELSLGVITFSEAQMQAIDIALTAERRAQPHLDALLQEHGPDGFFIKNLENVQGDERDVIFFSVGYGPDHAGKMTMTFGPLNRQGGERRLNVAVTRAREHVKVVASFRPDAIDVSRTKARGVRLLRQYMEYAERGPVALLGQVTSEGGTPDSPFEEAVIARIRQALAPAEFDVVSQVGVSGYRIDLAIRDVRTGRYLLGIECDGATYHSSKTARDRDRLRQSVLENLGWSIHRIWSTDWIKRPDEETAKVLQALEQVRQRRSSPPATPGNGPGSRSPRPKPVPAPASVPAPALVPAPGPRLSSFIQGTNDAPAPLSSSSGTLVSVPYRTAVLPDAGSRQELYVTPSTQIAPLVRDVVTVESPVHEQRVMRAVASAYGTQRVGSTVRATLQVAIDAAVRGGMVRRRGEFLWSPTMTTPPVRSLDESGQARRISEIAPEEIEAAAVQLIRVSVGIRREDIIAAIARELGNARTGGEIRTAIGGALDRLVVAGTIQDLSGRLSVSRAASA